MISLRTHTQSFLIALLATVLCRTAFAHPSGPVVVPQLAGTYAGTHHDWHDSLTLHPDGTYVRGNGDAGRWTFDGHTLVLRWTHWKPERLEFVGPGQFAAVDGHMRLHLLRPPDYAMIPGTYRGVHRDWRDTVTLRPDGTYARGNGDPGVWIFDGQTLVLFWQNWGPAFLTLERPGKFVGEGGTFSLHRAEGAPMRVVEVPPPAPPPMMEPPPPEMHHHREWNHSRLLTTDKRVYAAGEPVTVSWSGMPAGGQAWVTVVRREDPTDTWGDWAYTKTAEGNRSVTGPLTPGEYEVRAYFDNGTVLQDRLPFVVR